jgi:hypothetical protein
MKARVFGSCIVLLNLVLSLLPKVVLASEYKEIYKEVKATDILKHIENGDSVNLVNAA